MSEGRFERVEQWGSEPVSGLDGLHGLAAADFSGAATADGTWAFFLNGRVVGVFGGDLDAFRDAAGTAYVAPHDSLPLLETMLERGGETRATYYTNDTPLTQVEETLTEANFTGYVELSENVLSGDYYTVYHNGTSLHAAFVGASEELETGEEAAALAADEVGLYEVVKAPVAVHDLPEPEGEAVDEGGRDAAAAADSDEAASDDDPEPSAVDRAEASAPDEPIAPDADAPADESPAGDAPAETGVAPRAETESPDEAPTGAAEPEPRAEAAGRTARDETTSAASAERGGGPSTATEDSASGDSRFDDEAAWRETVSIPAVTPEESGGGTVGAAARTAGSSASEQTRDAADEASQSEEGAASTAALEAARERLAAVTDERDELAAERDDLREGREELRRERDRLQERVEELRAEVADLREQAATAPDSATGEGGRSMAAGDALDGTDLFVRYGSRGEPTLEDVAEGASAEEVRANLRLDHHTQFDADAATVGGESYEAFLRDTPEYGFLSWLVETLPFEVRETGHAEALGDLYAALPAIDRADLGGTVRVETEEGTTERSFDVVARDRMGEALVVADINDERAPVSGEMMTGLVDDATAVGTDGGLAAAFYVTASFFEPEALEAADDATGGGFLRRSNKESFVRTSRKRGFHLCLVERRNGAFYLNVPEL